MKKLFLIIAIITTAFSTNAQKVWTFDECVDYAMEHNIQILQTIVSQNNPNTNIR